MVTWNYIITLWKKENMSRWGLECTNLRILLEGRELVYSSPQHNIFSDADVYCIPCQDCKLKYIGETSRNLHIRLKEHKRDIRIGNSNNALFLHISQHNHNFDFNSAKMLTYIYNKNLRRIFEAAAISFLNSLNTRPGFYNISPYLSKHILNS